MEQIWKTVEQFHMLEQGDKVLLGVSGGPDSVALLHLLQSRAQRYGVELFVVHINHQLRPEAEQEADYVRQLADQYGIPFRLFSVDVTALAAERGMSLEQAGHEARFSCFREAAAQWQITKLALGHHRDDRAESLLLHLIRGCGLDGLASMPPRDGWLIRPLAQVSKQDLVHYCQIHQLPYFVDASNLEPGCLRNQIRLELLPQLRQYNPQMTAALLRLQDSAGEDLDYLEQCTNELWQQYGAQQQGRVCFPAQQLKQQHKALQRRLLRRLYGQLIGAEVHLTFQQVEQMVQLAANTQGSQQLSLAGGVVFRRQYDQLILEWQSSANGEGYHYRWDLRQPFVLKEWSGQFTATYSEQPIAAADQEPVDEEPVDEEPVGQEPVDQQRIDWNQADLNRVLVDADCLADTLEVRSRRPGDVVQPLGMQGHKKLKKFLIDKKVPAAERSSLPVLCSDDQIIWIPGYFLAECVRITDKTKRYCFLQCFRK